MSGASPVFAADCLNGARRFFETVEKHRTKWLAPNPATSDGLIGAGWTVKEGATLIELITEITRRWPQLGINVYKWDGAASLFLGQLRHREVGAGLNVLVGNSGLSEYHDKPVRNLLFDEPSQIITIKI